MAVRATLALLATFSLVVGAFAPAHGLAAEQAAPQPEPVARDVSPNHHHGQFNCGWSLRAPYGPGPPAVNSVRAEGSTWCSPAPELVRVNVQIRRGSPSGPVVADGTRVGGAGSVSWTVEGTLAAGCHDYYTRTAHTAEDQGHYVLFEGPHYSHGVTLCR